MTPDERARARLIRRVRQHSPELARYISRAFNTIKEEVPLPLLERFLATGDIGGVLEEIFDQALFEKATADIQKIYFGQFTDSLGHFGKDFAVTFGVLEPEIITAIQDLNGTLIQEFADSVREQVRSTVEEGLRQGINPRRMARSVRDDIGLGANQREWVNNLREELENNSRKALRRSLQRGYMRRPDGSLMYNPKHAGSFGVGKRDMELLERTLGTDKKLTKQQVDRIVGQYEKKLMAWNSEAHARTAALRANATAQHMATEKAIKEGILDGGRMISIWTTVGDSRVRPSHQATEDPNLGTVRFGEPFTTPDGWTGIIPAMSGWGCRCSKYDRYATKAEMEAMGMVGTV